MRTIPWTILAAVLTSFIASSGSEAQPTDKQSPSLTTLWTNNNAPSGLPTNIDASRLSLRDIAVLPDSAMLLVEQFERTGEFQQRKVGNVGLLEVSSQGGSARYIPVPMMLAGDMRLVATKQAFWIGGSANHGRSMFGGALSDGYLAKLDVQGRLAWEQTFGKKQRDRNIRDMVELPSGDVVVVGKDNWKTWLARISGSGRVVWENTFALSMISAVAVVGNDIFVAAYDDEEGAITPRRTLLTIRRFDLTGRMLRQDRIYESADAPKQKMLMDLLVSPSKDALYLFASWSISFASRHPRGEDKSLVTKLDLQGQQAWRTELSQSILQGNPPADEQPEYCLPKSTVLDDGDVLISCATTRGTIVTQLNSASGQLAQFQLPWTECEGRKMAIQSLVQHAKDNVRAWGYRSGCVWLGQLSLTRR
jgi:hypothetical protein